MREKWDDKNKKKKNKESEVNKAIEKVLRTGCTPNNRGYLN